MITTLKKEKQQRKKNAHSMQDMNESSKGMKEKRRMKLSVLDKFSSNNRRCAEPKQQSTRRFVLSNHSQVL